MKTLARAPYSRPDDVKWPPAVGTGGQGDRPAPRADGIAPCRSRRSAHALRAIEHPGQFIGRGSAGGRADRVRVGGRGLDESPHGFETIVDAGRGWSDEERTRAAEPADGHAGVGATEDPTPPWAACVLQPGRVAAPDRAATRLWGACRRAGLRRIRWHDLRHSFGSQLAMGGVPLRRVQGPPGERPHSEITGSERSRRQSCRSPGCRSPRGRCCRKS